MIPPPVHRILPLLLTLLTSCTTTPHPLPRQPVAPPASSFHTLTLALCEDYPEETRSLPAVRRDFDHLRQAGVATLRVCIGWDGVEPERGRYDWSFWDDFIRLAADYHIDLIPYVCYTPRWAATDPGKDYWRSPPRDPADFARFVGLAAARYKGRVHSWELWNEPDNPQYWLGTSAQLAPLITQGSAAVRRADPTAKVVLGGIAWRTDFVAELLRDHHVGPSIDVINAHSYYETWSPDPTERLPEFIRRLDDLIAWYGNGQQIWMAEVGYSDYAPHGTRDISSVYRARLPYEHTPDYQAVQLIRMLTLIQSTDLVSLTAWYRINDLPSTEQVIGDTNNRHLGLVSTTNTPKPALAALHFYSTLLAGPTRSLDPQTLATRPLSSDTEIHCFQRPDGSLVLVAWLRTNLPGYRPTSTTDPRTEPVDLTLPGHYTRATAYNATGHPTPPPPVTPTPTTTHLRLTLPGGTVTLIHLTRG